LLFAFITWLGFVAANWRKGDLDLLHGKKPRWRNGYH
jgi:hypothetical protein